MSEHTHEPDQVREHEKHVDEPPTEEIPTGATQAEEPRTGEPQAGEPQAGEPRTDTTESVEAEPDRTSVLSSGEPSPAAGAPAEHPATAPGAAPAAPVQAAQRPYTPTPPAPQYGPRVGTVVWGLVVLAVGLGVLAAAAGARIDFGLAAILLLGGAGVALVAGSIVSSFRRRGEQ
ncbi:hypothetical protein GCM10028784_09220 [Myceligenerans cantabricum]